MLTCRGADLSAQSGRFGLLILNPPSNQVSEIVLTISMQADVSMSLESVCSTPD